MGLTKQEKTHYRKRIAFHLRKDDGLLTYHQLAEIFPRCDYNMFYDVARELGYDGLVSKDIITRIEAQAVEIDREMRERADWKYYPNRRASFLAWKARRAREATRQGVWVFDAIPSGGAP